MIRSVLNAFNMYFINNRLAPRTLIFLALTAAAFLAIRPITIWTGWPEAMKCLTATAVLSWAEVAILWIRIAIAPNLDVQDAARDALLEPSAVASAIVFAVHQFTWAVRLTAFLLLYGVL
jgi:hypothetical protein